ncbi:MAG: hypothetical protein WA708_01485 [Acidobacteriaceae bacterium]
MRNIVMALFLSLCVQPVFPQTGCTTNCVITDPTSSQTVTQPSGTALSANYFNTQIANGVYYPLRYSGGNLCAQMTAAIAAMPATGGTLDIEGLSSVPSATCGSNPFAGVTMPLSVNIGPGKINTTVQWYVHSSFFHLRGAGMANTQLIYTGSIALKAPDGVSPGGVLELTTPTPATVYNGGDSVADMAIVGNANSPYAMLVDGTHHSQFRNLSLFGSAVCDYESKFAVVDDLDNIHSSIGDAATFGFPGSAAPNGMCLDGEDTNHATTAATLTNPLIEGHPTCGIELNNASSMVFSSGTSEGNGASGKPSTTANICDNRGQFNTFVGMDLEGGGSPTDMILGGEDETVIGGFWGDTTIISGSHNVIENGIKGFVTVSPGASFNTLENYRSEASGGTGITDNGTSTVISRITDSSLENPLRGMPWGYRDTTINPASFGFGAMPQEDFLRGSFGFNATAETLLSNTTLISGKPWSVVLIGDWSTALQFTTTANAPLIVVTSAAPTVTLNGGAAVTFSLNATHQLQAICSIGCNGSGDLAFFLGSMFMVQSQNSTAAAFDISTPTGISTNVLKANSIQTGSGAAITNTDNIPQVTATTSAGTCIPNGYLPVTVHGVTFHLATCQ